MRRDGCRITMVDAYLPPPLRIRGRKDPRVLHASSRSPRPRPRHPGCRPDCIVVGTEDRTGAGRPRDTEAPARSATGRRQDDSTTARQNGNAPPTPGPDSERTPPLNADVNRTRTAVVPQDMIRNPHAPRLVAAGETFDVIEVEDRLGFEALGALYA